MARSSAARLESVAGALADGATIEWPSRPADDAHAEVLAQLRAVAGLRVGVHGQAAERSWTRRAIGGAYAVGVAVAAAKVALALSAVVPTLSRGPLTGRAVLFSFFLVCFGLGGLLMMAGGARDRRLQLLGAFYVVIASSFVKPFFAWTDGPFVFLADLLSPLTPESFFAAGVWTFAWAFPREPLAGRARLMFGTLVATSVLLGWALLAVNALWADPLWLEPSSPLRAVLDAFNRRSAQSWYWPLIFVYSCGAVPFFARKLRTASGDGRRRARRFLSALAIGLAPLVSAAVVAPFVPALRTPGVQVVVDLAVYAGLASIVPMTAYAVAFRHVMTLEFVVRATLQYALARYAIWAAILAPVSYLVIDVFVHRAWTFLQYIDARHPQTLLAYSGIGLVALTFRPHLMRLVDRWFLREPVDSADCLARLDQRLRAGETLRDLAAGLATELAASVHAAHSRVLLLAAGGHALVAPDGATAPLSRDAVLVELVRSTGRPLQFEPRSEIARLLPEDEQGWLDDAGCRVLAPMLGASGTLLGVAVLGDSVTTLPYTAAHAALVMSMCGHAALQLENRSLRQSRPADEGALRSAAGVDWHDEPASVCPQCSTLTASETRRCRCGGVTRPSALPLFVRGKFRLQRQLGAGGTGVVYLATDLGLERQVAIKTLPRVRREFATRLRREARVMASVQHPNLATIYGVEEWRDTPLLVVEYLEGGTLFDVLARGPLSFEETLDLGITLADVLDRVHGAGLLHRDIKPSNIGFTQDGVPKLLDFGLAALLDRSTAGGDASAFPDAAAIDAAIRGSNASASSTLTMTNQVVGTPIYMSPEALDGASPHEGADLWSLAMVLYESLAGRHPFAGGTVTRLVQAIRRETVPDVRQIRPECPHPLAAFLGEALSADPSRRPPTAADFRTALRALRAPVPIVR